MAKYLPGFSEFSVGVNYWASHAGTKMWSKFSAEEVDADFAALRDAGVKPSSLQFLRVSMIL